MQGQDIVPVPALQCFRVYELGAMYRVCLIIAGLLLIFSSLTGDELISANSEEEIPSLVLAAFYGEYAVQTPVVVRIDAGRFTPQITALFKERLHQNRIPVFEQETDEFLLLSIDYERIPQLAVERKLFSRKVLRSIEHNFTYQLTHHPSGRISHFDRLTILTKEHPEKQGMKWYDPVLISAIVGSIAYLLYFGV